MIKGTKLYSVMHQKCPYCQEGDMFTHNSLSVKFTEMRDTCPACGFDFVKEPSFYFGAMYFSYAFQTLICVVVYLILRFTVNPDTWTYVAWMIVGSVLFLPWNYRWSRAAWLNLFSTYKKKDTNKYSA